MQTDAGREAGYRSKGVRNALASGAVKLLEASRERSKRMLSGDKRRQMLGGDATASGIVDVSPLEEEEIIQNVIEEKNMEYAPDGLYFFLHFYVKLFSRLTVHSRPAGRSPQSTKFY